VTDRAARARTAACLAWLALIAFVSFWPAGNSGISWAAAAIATIPLVLPFAWLLRGSRLAYGFAMLALAPVLALAVMELLANAAARTRAAMTLALILVAFASLIAALRAMPATRARKES
jgi:uncharacterized membrane protein